MNTYTEHYCKPDGWDIGSILKESDWPAAEYYLPTIGSGPVKAVAVRVRQTGKAQWRNQEWMTRCAITFIGDGEPDVESRGWLSLWARDI